MSYSAAISACEKGKRWDLALQLLAGMRSAGVEADVGSYNAARACGFVGFEVASFGVEPAPPLTSPIERVAESQARLRDSYGVNSVRGRL